MARPIMHPDRVFIGTRTGVEARVWLAWPGGGRWLRAKRRKGQWFHGSGLEWGYEGSGPAQLALEILIEATGDVERASAFHQSYKRSVIAGLPRRGWVLHREAVLASLEDLERIDRIARGDEWAEEEYDISEAPRRPAGSNYNDDLQRALRRAREMAQDDPQAWESGDTPPRQQD